MAVAWIGFIVILSVLIINNNDSTAETIEITSRHNKIAISFITVSFIIMANIFMPSTNTIKAFIGVKAVQVVGEVIDETSIPERSIASLNKLWDKVDGYIETIEVKDIEFVTKPDTTSTK